MTSRDEREALVKRLELLRPYTGLRGSLTQQENERILDDAIAALAAHPSAGEPAELQSIHNHEVTPHCCGCYIIKISDGSLWLDCNECGHLLQFTPNEVAERLTAPTESSPKSVVVPRSKSRFFNLPALIAQSVAGLRAECDGGWTEDAQSHLRKLEMAVRDMPLAASNGAQKVGNFRG